MGNPLGVKGLRYRAPIAWDLTPTSLKQSPALTNVKYQYLLKQHHDKNVNASFFKEVLHLYIF